MKKTYLSFTNVFITHLFFLLLLDNTVYSQNKNVGIGTTNPHPSAILHLQDSAKGLLIPQVKLQSTSDIVTVPNPAVGLLVYNTGAGNLNTPGFFYWNGALWIQALGSAGTTGPTGPQGFTGTTGPSGADGIIGVTGPTGPTGSVSNNVDTLYATYISVDTIIANYIQVDSIFASFFSADSIFANYIYADTIVASYANFDSLFVNGTSIQTIIDSMINASGTVGPTGTTGADGATGQQGPIGNDGATGPTGPTGATGPRGDQYSTTSTTTFTIQPGPVCFTVDTALAYSIAQSVVIAFDVSNSMIADITSYDENTGQMCVNVVSTTGSGTYSSWTVNLNGASGPEGAQGTTGPTGTAGTDGSAGTTGPTGPSGTDGAAGATGTTGSDGVAGATGTTGSDGAAGTTGPTGSTGASGPRGDQYSTTSSTSFTIQPGPVCFTVDTGLAYSIVQSVVIATDINNSMIADITSYDENTGQMCVNVVSTTGSGTYSSWTINLNGAAGPEGAQGPTGPTGTNGTAGANGTTGPSGADGTAGANGTTGPTGPTGTNGTAGANGAAGPTGPSGADGTAGANGPTGTTGPSGADGTAGANGPTGTTGPSGADGTAGANGPTGPSGTNGTTGPTGPTWTISSTTFNNSGTFTINSDIPSSITSGNAAWLTGGNSSTVAGTNFLGTTDGVPLDFRTNNNISFRITQGTAPATGTGGRLLAYYDGTAATPIYSFNTSSGTGMYLSAANQLSFATNGTEKMRIASAGTVQLNSYTTNGFLKTTGGNGTLAVSSAVNLTTDVTGVLPIANGGTNTSTIGSNGSIAYSNGTALTYSAVGTSGYVLSSGGAGAPAWTDPASLGVRWNSIIAPNGNATIVHAGFTTNFTFNSVTTGTAFSMSSSSLTSGALLDLSASALTSGDVMSISSTSTAGNTSALLGLYRSGTNSTDAVANYGIYSSVSNGASGANTGTNYAGYFTSSGTGTNMYNVGVRGTTNHIDGDGIVGTNTAPADAGIGGGVYGRTGQSSGFGVLAENTNADGIGLLGYISATASSTGSGVGIYGLSNQGAGLGGYFEATDTAAIGLIGINSASSNTGSGDGVQGYSSQIRGFGVWGNSSHTNGNGVVGTGNNLTTTYFPPAGAGVVGNGDFFGVYGVSQSTVSTGSTPRAGGYFTSGNGSAYAYVGALTDGAGSNGTTARKIEGLGSVNTVVKNKKGEWVVLSAPEAPENLFEDYGEGQLVNGFCHINIDETFSGNITVNEKHPLRVFVQLEDDCKGVYITNKTKTGFDVVELQSGQSSVKFTWHVIANRADQILDNGTKLHFADERFAPAIGLLPMNSKPSNNRNNNNIHPPSKKITAPEIKKK